MDKYKAEESKNSMSPYSDGDCDETCWGLCSSKEFQDMELDEYLLPEPHYELEDAGSDYPSQAAGLLCEFEDAGFDHLSQVSKQRHDLVCSGYHLCVTAGGGLDPG